MLIQLEHSHLLNGALVFSPILLAVDFVVIAHYLVHWRYSYCKTGWAIDYWHFSVFMAFILPVFIMYPFAGSLFNYFTIGQNCFLAASYVDTAYVISFIGYAAIFLGRYFADLLIIAGILNGRQSEGIIMRNFEGLLYRNINSRTVIGMLCGLVIPFVLSIIVIQIKTGYLFNPRAFFMAYPEFRPLYNLTLSLNPIAIVYVGLKWISNKRLSSLAVLLILTSSSLFLGTRGAMLGPLLTLFAFYLFSKQRSSRISVLVAGAIMFSSLVVVLEALRSKIGISTALAGVLGSFLYGNNFSDVRDFAWILSKWDGSYIFGRSYVAALISFIPSSILAFRQEWSISKVTNAIVGLDPTLHSGLRPGPFGEAYFNFGLFGVFMIGLVAGISMRLCDLQIKSTFTNSGDIVAAYVRSARMMIVGAFFITAGFWGLYTFLLINIFLFAAERILQVSSIEARRRYLELRNQR